MIRDYINVKTCTIIRERTHIDMPDPDVIRVYDEEGDLVFAFPNLLPDDEVKTLLRQFNSVYDRGFRRGDEDRRRRIKAILEGNDE